MRVLEKEILVPRSPDGKQLLQHFSSSVNVHLLDEELPIRFVVAHTDEYNHHCELAILTECPDVVRNPPSSIFEFRRRTRENTDQFNAVILIPTGIDCAIGGEAGDATPVARLLASVCDQLIIHPNVVNASDINELTDNCLYVEGSVICRLLMGTVGLQKVRSNRILLVVEEHDSPLITESVINAASAARATLGIHCAGVVRMADCFVMQTTYSNAGRSSGQIEHLDYLREVLEEHRSDYDAIAITSVIQAPDNLPEEFLLSYYQNKMVNPWGGVEAMLTHAVSLQFDTPSAHSPMIESVKAITLDMGVVDPRKAAEAVSRTFLQCILKGLHRSPRLVTNPEARKRNGILNAEDISCLVIPEGCLGLPTLAALEQEIPVIAVRENNNLMRNNLEELPFRNDRYFSVANYLEAAGLMAALKAGIEPSALRRPLDSTRVSKYFKSVSGSEDVRHDMSSVSLL